MLLFAVLWLIRLRTEILSRERHTAWVAEELKR
jgi:hypothetical protein